MRRMVTIRDSLRLAVLAAWVFGGFVMFVGAFLERGVFTHLFRLVVFDSSLACMLESRSL